MKNLKTLENFTLNKLNIEEAADIIGQGMPTFSVISREITCDCNDKTQKITALGNESGKAILPLSSSMDGAA